MVHGWGGNYVGDTPAITLSDGTIIPAIHEHDGPQGVANGNKDVTCWPAALTVVQTWDEDMMFTYGAAMGKEQYLKGSNVMLGPGTNLARLPWNGRNFEYRALPRGAAALTSSLPPPLTTPAPLPTAAQRARTPGWRARWWPVRSGAFSRRMCLAASSTTSSSEWGQWRPSCSPAPNSTVICAHSPPPHTRPATRRLTALA